jgi:hypothetical protein
MVPPFTVYIHVLQMHTFLPPFLLTESVWPSSLLFQMVHGVSIPLISMCLTHSCRSGSLDRHIMLHLIMVGWDKGSSISRNSDHSHEFSFALLNAAMYSALHDDAATVICFHAFQETMPEPNKNAYPPHTSTRIEVISPVWVTMPSKGKDIRSP